mgnify:CR=1 FL=1|jgi:hypothetical protein
MDTLNNKIKKVNESIHLTDKERDQMDGVITQYMDIHPLENMNMNNEKQSHTFSFSLSWGKKLALSLLTITIVLGSGSGVALAAQESLPGDFLYSVKINVNEEIKSALIFSAKEKAEWEAKRLEIRLAEMQKVVSKTGTLSSELVRDTQDRVITQTEKVSEAAKDLEKMGDTESIYELLDRMQTSLENYNNILQDLLSKNLPVGEEAIKQIVDQVKNTEQTVKLAQQQTVDHINEIFTDDFRFVNEEPQYGRIVFNTPNRYSRLKVNETHKITIKSENLPEETSGYVSLWYPSGKKKTDLFILKDISIENFNWKIKDILPGTWRLRVDLREDGKGQYWLSDVFVIEAPIGSAVQVITPAAGANIEQGENYLLNWKVIDLQDLDNEKGKFDLYTANGNFVRTVNTLPALYKEKAYWNVDKDIDPGKYFLRIGVNSNVYGDSPVFSIIESIPSIGSAVQVLIPMKNQQIQQGYDYLIRWNVLDLQGLDNEEGKFDLYASSGKFVKTIDTAPALYKATKYLNIETDVPPGQYFLRIGVNDQVYGDSGVFTIIEKEQKLPDLTIKHISLDGISKVGEYSNIIFRVQNIGSANYEAKHAFGAQVYYDDKLVFEDNIITDDSCAYKTFIEPYDVSCEVRTGFIPNKPGTYLVKVFSKYADYAPEINQDNNSMEEKLEVTGEIIENEDSPWYNASDPDAESTFDINQLFVKSTTKYNGGEKTDYCQTFPDNKIILMEGVTTDEGKFNTWQKDCSELNDAPGNDFQCLDGRCVDMGLI